VDDYFVKISIMAEELHQTGVIIDDGELSLIVLNGLDDSYESFITSQMARIEDIDFSSLLGALRSFESRRHRIIGRKGFATANIVQSTPSATLASSTISSASGIVICQICDKKGHHTRACYNRHNEQRFPFVQDNKSKYRNNNKRGKCASNANAVWYPDSGATDHVSSDSASIQEGDKSSKFLTVANGKSNL